MKFAYPVLLGFLEYSGGVDTGQFHSIRSLKYRDGTVYQGYFEGYSCHRTDILIYSNVELMFEGELKHGNSYAGDLLGGKKYGHGKLVYGSKSAYKGG